MSTYVSDVAFTPSVKATQERLGSRKSYAGMEQGRGWSNTVTPELAEFIGQRDSFYMATASADGRPYIQHRGGPAGFLKVIDEKTLAFADYGGNRQYISMGNLSENDKVSIFLMDYPNRRRIKIWGRAVVVENDPDLLETLSDSGYSARPERIFLIQMEAWDVNCPQHIAPRYTDGEWKAETEQLRERIAVLEEENSQLRKGL